VARLGNVDTIQHAEPDCSRLTASYARKRERQSERTEWLQHLTLGITSTPPSVTDAEPIDFS
jgi:hypothetical protein